jgi:hypothetical protein
VFDDTVGINIVVILFEDYVLNTPPLRGDGYIVFRGFFYAAGKKDRAVFRKDFFFFQVAVRKALVRDPVGIEYRFDPVILARYDRDRFWRGGISS